MVFISFYYISTTNGTSYDKWCKNGYDTKSQRTGILSGYETDLSPSALNASSLSSDITYINNNLPVININKIERRKTYKLGE